MTEPFFFLIERESQFDLTMSLIGSDNEDNLV